MPFVPQATVVRSDDGCERRKGDALMDVQVGICQDCDAPVVRTLGTGRCSCECATWLPIVSQETGRPIMAGIRRPKETVIHMNEGDPPVEHFHDFPPGYDGIQAMMI